MPPVCSSSSSSRGLSERRLDTGGSGKREEWRSRLNELRVEKSQESFQLLQEVHVPPEGSREVHVPPEGPQEVHVPPEGLRRFMLLLKASGDSCSS